MLSKALNAAAWGYAGSALKIIMQLGVQIVLARMLGPGEYGLFAVGVTIVSFGILFSDVASSALIPRAQLDDTDIRFAFTWQIIVSLTLMILVMLMSEHIAVFLNEPRAASVIKYLSLVFVLNAFGGVSLALLRRKIDFKKIQIAQVVGYFVGYVLVALPYAHFIKPDITALMLAWITQTLVTSIYYITYAKHSTKPLLICNNGKALANFGINAFFSNIGSWAITNIDKMIIAKTSPIAQVGLYATSSNLLSTPLSLIYSTLQQVMFSSTAQLTQMQIGKLMLTLISIVMVLVGLIYTFTFVNAEAIILMLYGIKWHAAVPFLQAFSVTMLFNALAGVITPLLWSRGAVNKDAKIQILMAFLILIGGIVASKWSAITVAWWVTFVFGLRALILMGVAINICNDIKKPLMLVLAKATLFIIACSIILSAINLNMPTQTHVLLKLMVAFGTWFILVVLAVKFKHLISNEFSSAISLVISKLVLIINKIILNKKI